MGRTAKRGSKNSQKGTTTTTSPQKEPATPKQQGVQGEDKENARPGTSGIGSSPADHVDNSVHGPPPGLFTPVNSPRRVTGTDTTLTAISALTKQVQQMQEVQKMMLTRMATLPVSAPDVSGAHGPREPTVTAVHSVQGLTRNSMVDTIQTSELRTYCPIEGVPDATLKGALKGEFVYLDQFLLNLVVSPDCEGELCQYLENGQISYKPRRSKRKIVNLATWLEAWGNYERLMVRFHGLQEVYEHMAEYRAYICDCDKKYMWSAIAAYDIRHRAKLSRKSVYFSTADVTLQAQLLDASAIKSNALRCYRCKSFQHNVSECPFPQGAIQKTAPTVSQKKKRYAEISTVSNVWSPTALDNTFVSPVTENCPMTCVLNQDRVVKSPLNYEFWKQELSIHPDQEFVKTLLKHIKYGVDIGYLGNQFSCISPNWPSAYTYQDSVRKNILSNAEKGRLEGPFYAPPHQFFRASPLGAFPKKRSKKIRTIHDLSWPPGESVNEFINKHDYAFSFSTIDEAVRRCQQYDTPYMVKLDITDAYMHCVVRPEDRHLLGFTWEENGITEYWQYAVLPFGLSSAPKLFNDHAEALKFIMISRGASGDTLHYLDDFWSVSDSQQSANQILEIMCETVTLAGMEIQKEKTCGPSRIIEYLGIIMDTESWQLKISDVRLQEIKMELFSWKNKSVCTKRELLSLIGKLVFCAKVVRDGRKFVGRLLELSKRVRHLHHKVRLNKEARADIKWWLTCMESHNGTAMFPEPWDSINCDVCYCDASDVAAAGVFGHAWFVVPFENENAWMTSQTIAWRELYAIVVCIATFGDQLACHRLAVYTDNQTVMWCINNGKSLCPRLMALIRSLYWYTTYFKIDCRAFYISTYDNCVADALSRLQFDKVYTLQPGIDLRATEPSKIRCDF